MSDARKPSEKPLPKRCAKRTPFRDNGDHACIACGHDYDADKKCPNEDPSHD